MRLEDWMIIAYVYLQQDFDMRNFCSKVMINELTTRYFQRELL